MKIKENFYKENVFKGNSLYLHSKTLTVIFPMQRRGIDRRERVDVIINQGSFKTTLREALIATNMVPEYSSQNHYRKAWFNEKVKTTVDKNFFKFFIPFYLFLL